jgi:biopolymer transport protein ExbD
MKLAAILCLGLATFFALHIDRVFAAQTADILLHVAEDGSVDWDRTHFTDMKKLQSALAPLCTQKIKPNIRVRGDKPVRFEYVGRVIAAEQKAGCIRVGFLTEPPP